MELAVSEAARQLGVSRQRVLTLISRDDLPARRIGGRWILDSADVAWRERERPIGRPMAPRVAWGLIALAEGRAPAWLGPEQRSRLRARLRHHPSLEQVAAWARRRNKVLLLRGHPSALPRLLAASGAVPAGASARGHDIIDLQRVEVYLPGDRVHDVVRDLMLRDADRRSANAVVKVPQGLWPFDDEPGPVAVALDLWEAGDERSRRGARALYQKALAKDVPAAGTASQ